MTGIANFDHLYDKQKETAGAFATFVWLISGIYLFISSPAARLFSLSALIFLVVGMFVAAVIFGMGLYAVQRLLAKGFMRMMPGSPTAGKAAFVQAFGLLLMAAEAVLIFMVASWIFGIIHPAQASKEKTWIVLSLKISDGVPAEMAFDNPALPDITLEECKASLPQAVPNLMIFVKREPRLANAQLVNARCVKSVGDPIKPK